VLWGSGCLKVPFKDFIFKDYTSYPSVVLKTPFPKIEIPPIIIPPIIQPERVMYRDIEIIKNGTWKFTYQSVNYAVLTLEEAKQVIDELLNPTPYPIFTTYRDIVISQTAINKFEFDLGSHYIELSLNNAIARIDLLLTEYHEPIAFYQRCDTLDTSIWGVENNFPIVRDGWIFEHKQSIYNDMRVFVKDPYTCGYGSYNITFTMSPKPEGILTAIFFYKYSPYHEFDLEIPGLANIIYFNNFNGDPTNPANVTKKNLTTNIKIDDGLSHNFTIIYFPEKVDFYIDASLIYTFIPEPNKPLALMPMPLYISSVGRSYEKDFTWTITEVGYNPF